MPDPTLIPACTASGEFSPTVATIDLSALIHNLDQVRQRLHSTCEILAVVKADAYGHGAVPITRALIQAGVRRFGVATLQEGIALRQAGVRAPILVMGAVFPEQLVGLVEYGLTPIIYETATARQLAAILSERAEPYPVHIKVDTGMGRLGLSVDQISTVLQSSPFKDRLRCEGLMTHLADADSDDPTYTELQIQRFRLLLNQLEMAGLAPPLAHAANSAAILSHPSAHLNLVRPGLMLYGYSPMNAHPAPHLKPVMTLTTRIVQIRIVEPGQSVSYNREFIASRVSHIAVLPIGYADGYHRLMSNRAAVLIRGCRAPVVGRICMDMMMIDVTDIPAARTGDEVVLIGQQGGARISASDLATWAETIPYEILCAIGPRVTRRYCRSATLAE